MSFEFNSNRSYALVNIATKRALDLSSRDHKSVVGCPWTNNSTQHWTFIGTKTNFKIVNRGTGKYLSLASPKFGSSIVASSTEGTSFDSFVFHDRSDPVCHGSYHFTTKDSFKFLEVDPSSEKVAVGSYGIGDYSRQCWTIVPVESFCK